MNDWGERRGSGLPPHTGYFLQLNSTFAYLMFSSPSMPFLYQSPSGYSNLNKPQTARAAPGHGNSPYISSSG